MKKPSLLIIFLTVFLDLVGFGIVLPLLPRYSEIYGAEGFQIGLVIGVYSLMQLLFGPFWGQLSDRIGRRPVLLIGNAGAAISYVLFAISARYSGNTGLLILALSRIFAGICGATLSVASAYIADISTREERSKRMGLIGMAFGLGFIFGPALGAFAADEFGLEGPGWIAAFFCAFNFILGSFILRESRQPNAEPAPPRPRLQQILSTLRHPRLRVLIGLFFMATFCFTCFESTLPLLVGSSSFSETEILNPQAVATRIRTGTDPVARLVRERAQALREHPKRDRDREQLTQLLEGPAEAKIVAQGLNTLARSGSLYDPVAFSNVSLSPETKKALENQGKDTAPGFFKRMQGQPAGEKKAPKPETQAHLNRLLLEDAFRGELKHKAIYFDEKHLGYLFAYCGLMAAFIQGGAIGRLIKKFGDQRLIAGSMVLVAVSLAMMPFMGSFAGLLLALGLFAAGSGINRAPTMGQISLHAPAEEQGSVMGVTQSIGTLARIVGPIFATTLYAIHIPLPYVICATVALATAFLAWKILCRTEATTPSGPPQRNSR